MGNKFIKKGLTHTTIFSIIEFPLASEYENLLVIYPTPIHYEKTISNAVILRKKGSPLPAIDLLIATIATEKDLILVSEDTHFDLFQEFYPKLKIITSETYIKKIN
jgi:hypothetical protein